MVHGCPEDLVHQGWRLAYNKDEDDDDDDGSDVVVADRPVARQRCLLLADLPQTAHEAVVKAGQADQWHNIHDWEVEHVGVDDLVDLVVAHVEVSDIGRGTRRGVGVQRLLFNPHHLVLKEARGVIKHRKGHHGHHL